MLNLRQNLPMDMVTPMGTTTTAQEDMAIPIITIRDLLILHMAIAMDIILQSTTDRLMATAMVDTTELPRVSL